jgi:hypothetical protein
MLIPDVAARFERCDAGMPRELCVKRSIEPISLSSFRALIAPATGSWGVSVDARYFK